MPFFISYILQYIHNTLREIRLSCPRDGEPGGLLSMGSHRVGHDWSDLAVAVLHYLQVCSNSCPLCQWCHPTISSSVVPFSSCLQSFPASGSFPKSQLFTSGGQRIGPSASTSVLPMIIQDWFPLGWTGCISLQTKGLSRVFSNTTVQKYQFYSTQLSLWSNSHIHNDYWKNHSFD